MVPILIGAFGVLIGSFLNVVVYRVPAGVSIASPPSACPGCDTPIAPRDNIPLVSWALLRGRCRSCAAPISIRYPLVELGTGLLFGLVAWRLSVVDLPSAIVLVAFLYLAAVAVALTLIDIDVHRLPDVIVLPSIAVGLVLLSISGAIAGDWSSVLRAVLAGLALFGLYFVMLVAYPSGMGFGDVKLAGLLGLYLGWLGWGVFAVGAMGAFILGGVFAVGLIATGRAQRGTGIPFGPWMLAGTCLAVAVGQPIWDAYIGLIV